MHNWSDCSWKLKKYLENSLNFYLQDLYEPCEANTENIMWPQRLYEQKRVHKLVVWPCSDVWVQCCQVCHVGLRPKKLEGLLFIWPQKFFFPFDLPMLGFIPMT